MSKFSCPSIHVEQGKKVPESGDEFFVKRRRRLKLPSQEKVV
jgi:hypothetical protein